MAKPKQGPSLFELIKSAANATAEIGEAAKDSTGRPAADSAPRDPVRPVTDQDAPLTPTSAPDDTPERPWDVTDGRVRFSLSQGGATLVLAAAMVLFGGAYWIGSRIGEHRGRERERRAIQAPVLDEIEQARRAPITRNLFAGIGEDPTMPVEEAPGRSNAGGPAAAVRDAWEPADVHWVPGHNYLVVQDFKKDARGDALRAREFLRENGVETAVIELTESRDYRYRLITVTGFNFENPVQRRLADLHQEKVHRLGRAYAAAGGRYDFESAYFKKLASDRW